MKFQNGSKPYALKNIKDIIIQPKWYLGAALIFIAVLGSVLGQQQTTIPNQEIVLQFTNEDISLNDAQRTIDIVEQELQRIGVADIQVSEKEDGRLVISYYSKTNVERIKKLLSTQKELALGFVSSDKNEFPFQFPSKETSISYNLDVYEIHHGQTSYSSLGGKCAIELKSGQQRFLNPNFYIPCEAPFIVNTEQILKVNFSFQRAVVIAKDYRSHKIPEVRAGPLS
ncbi:MAG: hypothetical protein ACOH2D_02350 [Gelidibacter sp.]|uniref:hypothetical protein n=1 Tax=Gelidibacter sp. TaxID=2018083 RepID=UPI00326722BA